MNHSHFDRPDIPKLPASAADRRAGSAARPAREVPRFKVVLHRDDNDLMFVVRSVMELTRFPRAEATHKMWEAQHSGRSVVLQTYRERAELFVEQFADRGLPASIEPA